MVLAGAQTKLKCIKVHNGSDLWEDLYVVSYYFIFRKLHDGVVGMEMWYTLGVCGLFMYLKCKKDV